MLYVIYHPDRFILPEYILDFGYVIRGTVSTQIVKVTNTGPLPVSYRAERRSLAGTGWFMPLADFGCTLSDFFFFLMEIYRTVHTDNTDMGSYLFQDLAQSWTE